MSESVQGKKIVFARTGSQPGLASMRQRTVLSSEKSSLLLEGETLSQNELNDDIADMYKPLKPCKEIRLDFSAAANSGKWLK